MERIELVGKLLHECRLSAAAVTEFFDTPRKYAEDGTLYMREVHFVVAIGPERSPTMSELAHQLCVTQGAVTQMATRLEKKGYVQRSKGAPDKRITTVSLTEKGKHLCADHIVYDRNTHSSVAETLCEFSDADLLKLIRYEHLVQEIFTNKR